MRKFIYSFIVLFLVFSGNVFAVMSTDGLDTSFSASDGSEGYDNNNLSNDLIWTSKIHVSDTGVITLAARVNSANGVIKVIQYSADGSTKTIDQLIDGSIEVNATEALSIDDDGFPIIGSTGVASTTESNAQTGGLQAVASVDNPAGTFLTKINNSSTPIWNTKNDVTGEEGVSIIKKLSNGKFLTLGTNNNDGNFSVTYTRYDSNGSLDTTFDANEKAWRNIIVNEDLPTEMYTPSALYEDDSGNLYLVAVGNTNIALIKTDANGILDTNFGTGGIKLTNVTDTIGISSHPYWRQKYTATFDGTNFYVPITQEPDGVISFIYQVDLNGNATPIDFQFFGKIMGIDSDGYGNIYAVGIDDSNIYKVWRIDLETAQIDTSFGTDGYVIIPDANATPSDTTGYYGIDVSTNGRYIAVGGDKFNVARFISSIPTEYTLTFNISDLNISTQNVQAVKLILSTDQTTQFSISSIMDGNSTYEIPITSGSYFLEVVLSNGSMWYYNFENNNLYLEKPTLDMGTIQLDVNSSYTLNLDSSKFVGYQTDTTEYEIVPFLERTITQSEYDNSIAKPWNMDSMYMIDYLKNFSYETQNAHMTKIIPEGTNLFIANLDLDYNTIDKYEAYEEVNVLDVNNTYMKKENNLTVENIKYVEELSASDLNNLYSDYLNEISFSNDVKAYKLHKKQVKATCDITNWKDIGQTISTDEFIASRSLFASSTYLERNYLEKNKVLLFSTTANELIEYDTSTQTSIPAGSWSIKEDVSCMDRDTNQSITLDLIDMDITLKGYSKDDISLSGRNVYYLEYNAQNTYKEFILLDTLGAKHLYNRLYINETIPMEVALTDTWTYLSLASSQNICSTSLSNIYYNDNNICSQDSTLEDMFPSVDMVLKYNANGWTYWASDNNTTYNMNKFSLLSADEGFIIKISSPTSVYLPINLFDLEAPKVINRYNQEGWYLVGNQFKRKPDSISIINGDLYYILNANETNSAWDIYTPKEVLKLDPNLKRVDNLKAGRSFWIYNK